jgi:peptidoglycan hydrolase-like protein with peptidoglycan-binding domain
VDLPTSYGNCLIGHFVPNESAAMPLSSPRFNRNPRMLQAAENSPPIKFGETSEAVRIMQMALVDLGFPMPITTKSGTQLADGIFGKETLHCVRVFQEMNGLTVDGIAGRNTLATLEELTMIFSNERATVDSAQALHRSALS